MAELASGIIRYIKVANGYGAVMTKRNGVPEGCSLSLIVANIYVTTLFRMLDDKFPGIRLGAIIDDRNYRHSDPNVIIQAVNATTEYDTMAGHVNNIDKTMLWSTDPDDRKTLAQCLIN